MPALGADANSKLASKINALIGQLRQKYETERTEIAHEVQEHLHSMRLAQSSALDAQSYLLVTLEELTARLDAMENASINPQSDMSAVLSQVNSLNESVRACQEEQQLLKAAIYHDRLIHDEERQSRLVQEEHLHLRIRQAEESSEILREHLHQWQAVNAAVMDNGSVLLQFVDDNHAKHGVHNLLNLQRDVLAEIASLKVSHKELKYKLESLGSFVEANSSRSTSANVRGERSIGYISPVKVTTGEVELHSPATVASLSSVMFGSHRGVSSRLQQGPSHTSDRHHDLRRRLEVFYAAHNPSKIASIPEILLEYKGAEEELLAALEVHYGAVGYFSSPPSI